MPRFSHPTVPRLSSWLLAALLVAIVVACYGPALRGGRLWDDDAHLTRPELQSVAGLGRIWTDLRATQQYYPVLHTAFWVEHRLWGDRTLPYHLLNVALHAGSSLLLVLALRRLWAEGRARGGGVTPGAEWLAGALFAVHPVAVESVAWISEQKNTLSLGFYLLAGLCYLRFDRTRRFSAYAAAVGWYLLAMGTKSVTATLPAALGVMLWWQRGRLSWRRDVLPLAPWLLLGAAAGTVTATVEHTLLGASGTDFALTAWQRVLLAGRVIAFYLGKLAWPGDLTFIYPHWDVVAAGGRWVVWPLAVVVATAGLWRWSQHSRGLLAGWLFYVGSLTPALGFVAVYPFRFSYVADHFQYLPSLGMMALAGAGIARGLAAARSGGRTLVPPLGLLLVAALAVLAHEQARNYCNAETLYRANLARNPASWMAHTNLGELLARTPAGEPEAISHFRAALRLKPDLAEAHYDLANLLARRPGEEPAAVAHYVAALRLRPDYAEAHANLALVLEHIPGRAADVFTHFEAALRLNPADARAHNNLAVVLETIPDRATEALGHFEAALRLDPDFVAAHENLANLLVGIPGREAEALAHYERTLALQADYPGAQLNLANALARLPGREPEAEQHFREALRQRPDDVEACNNLGILYAHQGRYREARQQWERAVQLAPDLAEPRRNLDLLPRSAAGARGR